MSTKLYMLMGLPGSGKTTVAKYIAELTGATRLSSDEERLKLWDHPSFTQQEHDKLYEFLNSRTRELLEADTSVIYDANLNRSVHREEKYKLAKKLNAETILIWVRTPRELAKSRRIEEVENHQYVPKNETPATMFERIAEILESPSGAEKYIELDGTKITSEYISKKLGI